MKKNKLFISLLLVSILILISFNSCKIDKTIDINQANLEKFLVNRSNLLKKYTSKVPEGATYLDFKDIEVQGYIARDSFFVDNTSMFVIACKDTGDINAFAFFLYDVKTKTSLKLEAEFGKPANKEDANRDTGVNMSESVQYIDNGYCYVIAKNGTLYDAFPYIIPSEAEAPEYSVANDKILYTDNFGIYIADKKMETQKLVLLASGNNKNFGKWLGNDKVIFTQMSNGRTIYSGICNLDGGLSKDYSNIMSGKDLFSSGNGTLFYYTRNLSSISLDDFGLYNDSSATFTKIQPDVDFDKNIVPSVSFDGRYSLFRTTKSFVETGDGSDHLTILVVDNITKKVVKKQEGIKILVQDTISVYLSPDNKYFVFSFPGEDSLKTDYSFIIDSGL